MCYTCEEVCRETLGAQSGRPVDTKIRTKQRSGVKKICGGDLFESVHALGEHEEAEDEGRQSDLRQMRQFWKLSGFWVIIKHLDAQRSSHTEMATGNLVPNKVSQLFTS